MSAEGSSAATLPGNLRRSLSITVLGCRGLAAAKKEKNAPYVWCTFNGKTYQTPPISGTLDPSWENETFKLGKISPLDNLDIQVWHKRRLARDKFIGRVIISLKEFSEAHEPSEHWFTLERRKESEQVSGELSLRFEVPTLSSRSSSSSSSSSRPLSPRDMERSNGAEQASTSSLQITPNGNSSLSSSLPYIPPLKLPPQPQSQPSSQRLPSPRPTESSQSHVTSQSSQAAILMPNPPQRPPPAIPSLALSAPPSTSIPDKNTDKNTDKSTPATTHTASITRASTDKKIGIEGLKTKKLAKLLKLVAFPLAFLLLVLLLVFQPNVVIPLMFSSSTNESTTSPAAANIPAPAPAPSVSKDSAAFHKPSTLTEAWQYGYAAGLAESNRLNPGSTMPMSPFPQLSYTTLIDIGRQLQGHMIPDTSKDSGSGSGGSSKDTTGSESMFAEVQRPGLLMTAIWYGCLVLMALTALPVLYKLFRLDAIANSFVALKDWVIQRGFLFRLRWMTEAAAYLGTFYLIAFGYSLAARYPLFADLVLVFGALLSLPCMALTLRLNTELLDTPPRSTEPVLSVLTRIRGPLIGAWMIAFLLPLSVATRSSGLSLILFAVVLVEALLYKDFSSIFTSAAAIEHPKFFTFTVFFLLFSVMFNREDSLFGFFSILFSLPVHAGWGSIFRFTRDSALRTSIFQLLFASALLGLIFGMCGHLQSLLLVAYCIGSAELLKEVYNSSVSVGVFITAALVLVTSLVLTYTALPSYLCLRFF